MPDERQASGRQSLRFLWLFALAWAGGAIAYVPFLTILLPMRVTDMVGSSAVELLAYITFCGALAASSGNILFGWLSDRSRRRRPWIATGLILTVLLLLLVATIERPWPLLGMIVLWQLALNMMLGPLGAWAADNVPRHQLGFLGGLMAFAPALGSLTGALVTLRGLAGADARLAMVAILVLCAVTPALLFARPRPVVAANADDGLAPVDRRPRWVIALMWLARLLVQIAEAALFAYLYLYFRTVAPEMEDADIARLFGVVLTVAVPAALLIGKWADRHARPIRPLAWLAATASVGLFAMAGSDSVAAAVGSYVLFGLATAIFLSLHSSQTLRILPRPERRGLDLGLFNLTNTIPSLIMPWLTLALVPSFGFAGLFLLLGTLVLTAALLLTALPRLR